MNSFLIELENKTVALLSEAAQEKFRGFPPPIRRQIVALACPAQAGVDYRMDVICKEPVVPPPLLEAAVLTEEFTELENWTETWLASW